jgi:tRNA-specific 2-thiouridylase
VVENARGERLGSHAGHFRYTVGQRRGLGVSGTDRLYVISIDPEANRVVVGGALELETSSTDVSSVRFLSGENPRSAFRAEVRVRHRAPEVPATVHPRPNGTARVVFDRPVRAVAPGQSCVFYRGDVVLGGGVITRARKARVSSESAGAGPC